VICDTLSHTWCSLDIFHAFICFNYQCRVSSDQVVIALVYIQVVVQHFFALRKAQTFPHQPRNAVSQCEVVSFHINCIYEAVYFAKYDCSYLGNNSAIVSYLDELSVIDSFFVKVL